MFKNFKVSIILVLLVVILLNPYSNVSQAKEMNVIRVSGISNIETEPDIAYIRIKTISEGKESKKVLRDNGKKMNKLMEELIKYGIEKDYIKTESIYVYPIYNYGEDEPALKGYRVTNEIKVKTEQLNSIGEIIDLSIDSGADEIGDIEFNSSKYDELYNKALTKALKDAESKAKSLAETMNVTIENPSLVEETSKNNRIDNNLVLEENLIEDYEEEKVPINIDNITISASLIVEYSY